MARVKIVAGAIQVTVDGIEYTRRQVTALLDHTVALAAVLEVSEELASSESSGTPIGFTATVERATEFVEPLWFDNEE